MQELKVQSNGHRREVYSQRLVKYYGEWYDLSEFVRIVPISEQVGFDHGVSGDSPLLAWDGIATDSYFSAVLVRYDPDDSDYVIMARAAW